MATVAIIGGAQCYALKVDVGAPLTKACVRGLLRLIARGMRQRLLVVEHRAEIAHVEPAFKEVRMNRGAMGLASQEC